MRRRDGRFGERVFVTCQCCGAAEVRDYRTPYMRARGKRVKCERCRCCCPILVGRSRCALAVAP